MRRSEAEAGAPRVVEQARGALPFLGGEQRPERAQIDRGHAQPPHFDYAGTQPHRGSVRTLNRALRSNR
jgi:hypothetical protein